MPGIFDLMTGSSKAGSDHNATQSATPSLGTLQITLSSVYPYSTD